MSYQLVMAIHRGTISFKVRQNRNLCCIYCNTFNTQIKHYVSTFRSEYQDAHFGLMEQYDAPQQSNWTWLQTFTLTKD